MIAFKLELSDKFDPKRFRPALGRAMLEACRLWHQQLLPKHFQHGAAIRYGYEARSTKYQQYKRRRRGSPPALVYTGRSRDNLTARFAFLVTFSVATGRATGRFIVPDTMRYFWMTQTGHPNKPEEMKRVREDERDMLLSYIEARTLGLLNNPQSTQVKVAQ